jgi:hypothetical protein
MKKSISILAGLSLLSAIAGAPMPGEFEDPFLDNFVGDWHVERKVRGGHTEGSAIHGDWVLKHNFIELRYGGPGAPYEANVFIGFDDSDKSYVCHWIDGSGARYSAVGRGKLDKNKTTIVFRFHSKEGGLTNKFTFDPQTKTRTSLIRQVEKGEWKTFLEEKWTKVEAAK